MSEADIVDGLYYAPYVPRPRPTPIPEAAWNDEPTYCLRVNGEWVSHILGVMVALDQPDTWQGSAEEIAAARYQVVEIMTALMEHCEEIPVTDYIIGEIRMFAFTALPTGWLACDGSAISRTTYADLFAAIGITYGVGDGTTTFTLPNAAHRSPYGDGDAGVLTDLSLGDVFGDEFTALATANIPSHDHAIIPSGASVTLLLTTAGVAQYNLPGSQKGTTTQSRTGSTGSGTPFSIQSPGFTVRFGIYAGV